MILNSGDFIYCVFFLHRDLWVLYAPFELEIIDPQKGQGSCAQFSGMGSGMSSQTGESMHKAFLRYLLKYSPHWTNVDLLNDELFRATTSWASKCLSP